MSNIGFDVYRSTSIHDRREDILEALAEAEKKSDVVLITGGLGPTSDDITKQTLCEYFSTKLVMNDRVLQMIMEMLAKRNFKINENNRKQAEVPEICRVLENQTGTAPGMWFDKNDTIFISMPGVPHEMKHIMNRHVLPELRKKFTSQAIVYRNIMTYGIFEARLAEILADFESEMPENVKLAYLPAYGIIKLRLTGTGALHEIVQNEVNIQAEKLYKIIPEYIYGENEEMPEVVISRLLKQRSLSLSTAESCTGGEIAHLITSVSGSSAYFKGTVVAYANEIKSKILGVSAAIIEKNGAVSREVVEEMASGAQKLFGTDYAISTSGIAGPEGGTEAKPVGTVWIAVASKSEVIAEKHVFTSDRISNIRRFSLAAMNLLRKQILKG
jgi:nicotinamide-nucleotide amidase